MSRHTGIVFTDPERLSQRTFISDVSDIPGNLAASYGAGAIVPHVTTGAPLERATPELLLPFQATDHTPEGGCIEIIGFTHALREGLRLGRETERTECLPDELTTTKNTENDGLGEGLHFDEHEGLPLQHRLNSERRVGVNMGPGNRFLLLGTVDIFDVAQELSLGPEARPTTGHLREYAARNSLRCLWILLQRGEGYIAPTELIVHDGSTFRMPQPSTIRFWLGPWKRGQFGSIV